MASKGLQKNRVTKATPKAVASLSSYNQAPRKVRLVANLVRGKSVENALLELNFRAKRAAPVFAKLIQSAVANAKALGLDVNTLVVKEIRVDKGAILKRNRPRAQGRAFPIHKHTSHIMLTLSDASPEKAKTAKTKKAEEGEVKAEKKTKTAPEKKSSKNTATKTK